MFEKNIYIQFIEFNFIIYNKYVFFNNQNLLMKK